MPDALTYADSVAAEHCRHCRAQGMSPCEIIASLGRAAPLDASPDYAHHAVAAAWMTLRHPMREAA